MNLGAVDELTHFDATHYFGYISPCVVSLAPTGLIGFCFSVLIDRCDIKYLREDEFNLDDCRNNQR
jgi:hypothetical protein